MKNITVLNFSTRKNGNCSQIVEFIANYYANDNICNYVIDQRIGPCGGCDYECLRPEASCPNVTSYQQEIMNAVIASNLAYLILPNYCGFPCANYLAFNERSVGFFNMDRNLMAKYMSAKKRFIIVSNSESSVFDQAMRQQTDQKPDVLYMKTGKYGKGSIHGDMMESDAAQADLKAFLTRTTT